MSADHVVAGTGSRSLRVAPREAQVQAWDRCRAAVRGLHDRHGDRLVLMSGCAEGWDEVIARVAATERVRLWAAVPNRGYGAHYWGRNSLTGRDRSREFADILAAAWRVTYVMEDVHGTNGLYLDGVHSNFVRNYWMVDTAAEFLVWDPTSRGTAHCLAVIRKAGKPYRVLSDHQPALIPETS